MAAIKKQKKRKTSPPAKTVEDEEIASGVADDETEAAQSADDQSSKGRFSEEEKVILFEVIRQDVRLLHEFLHQTKARTHGRKGWMHEIGARFNQRAPNKRRLDAVRHHLLLRKSSQGPQDEFSQVHILLNHAVYCSRRDTCTKCLLLDRYRVQQGLARCGLANCIACDDVSPHVNDPYDAEALRLQISTRLAARRSGSPRQAAQQLPNTPTFASLALGTHVQPPAAPEIRPPPTVSPTLVPDMRHAQAPVPELRLPSGLSPSAGVFAPRPEVCPTTGPKVGLDLAFLLSLQTPPSLVALQKFCLSQQAQNQAPAAHSANATILQFPAPFSGLKGAPKRSLATAFGSSPYSSSIFRAPDASLASELGPTLRKRICFETTRTLDQIKFPTAMLAPPPAGQLATM